MTNSIFKSSGFPIIEIHASDGIIRSHVDELVEQAFVDQFLARNHINSNLLLTKDGSVRKRKPKEGQEGLKVTKRAKNDNPWQTIYFLRLIRDPNVQDPLLRSGKEFRRLFRVPFPVFESLIQRCRATGDACFNYPDKNRNGQPNIPLELKVLTVLRILAGGLMFKDGSLISQYISETETNRFFKKIASYSVSISRMNIFVH